MKKKEIARETLKVLILAILLAMLRWLPARTYNRVLNKFAGAIHKEAFEAFYAQDFVDVVKFTRTSSQGYVDALQEFEVLKGDVPTLKSVYPMLLSNLRNYRKKAGLHV